MSDVPGDEIGLEDKLLIALIEGLIGAVPGFANWVAGLVAGEDEKPSVTDRVREILPEKSRSRAAAERIEREQSER